MKTKKEQVLELLKSIETGSKSSIDYINPTHYTQHNLASRDGLDGFGEVLSQLAQYPEPAQVNTVRIFEDGDYVFAHTEYNFFGQKVGFDIFRFEDGKIVEHWDNLRDASNHRNPSNHTLTDGEYSVRDIEKTEDNKRMVSQFVHDVLIERDMSNLSSYFDKDNYIQHNERVGDGVTTLRDVLESRREGSDDVMIYNHLHKVLGEGNFVLTVGEGAAGANGGTPTAFYDLFRLSDGKIAEHWDISQIIPEKSDWKNQNGKFNFTH